MSDRTAKRTAMAVPDRHGIRLVSSSHNRASSKQPEPEELGQEQEKLLAILQASGTDVSDVRFAQEFIEKLQKHTGAQGAAFWRVVELLERQQRGHIVEG